MTTTTSNPATDQVVLAQLKAMGFSDKIVESPRRLIVSSGGREKTGKTHFALTAPEPIVYLNIDIGTEGVIGKFQKGFDGRPPKQILIYDIRVPRESKQDIWVSMWNDFKVRVRKAYDLKSGTVVWDTATEAHELARLSHFGRLEDVKPSDYAVVNNEWRDVLRIAFDSPVNTVFIHKMKAIWRVVATSGGRSQLTKTNDYELSGFSEMDYLAQVNLIHYREGQGTDTAFSVYIKDCRHSHGITGQVLRGQMNNFEFLLSLVHDK